MGAADHPASVLESLADVVSLGVLEGNCSQGFRFGGNASSRRELDAGRPRRSGLRSAR